MNSTFQDLKLEIGEKRPDVCFGSLQCMHESYTFLKNCIIIALIQQFFAVASFVLHSWNVFSAFYYLFHKKELLNNKWMKKPFALHFFHRRQFLMWSGDGSRERELQFSEYFRSKLFVKYHEFNIMGQVSDLWCMLKY